MPGTRSQPVSELLAQWRAGDEESLDRLVPLVYNELRRLAHNHLRRERPGHTLQTTALVHEAYLSLAKQHQMDFEGRAHFFAICANLMRQILVQYARHRKAAKRDGGYKITLDDAMALPQSPGVDLIALDDALNGLAKLDPQQSRIVELRFFGGLSIEETAQALGISPPTVNTSSDTQEQVENLSWRLDGSRQKATCCATTMWRRYTARKSIPVISADSSKHGNASYHTSNAH